jgi:hypothetical protein
MAITRVGASQGTSSNATSVTTLTLTRSAGTINNLLVVSGFSSLRGAALTISDTQTNTWNTANPDFDDATNGTRCQSWYALAKNTSSTTVTVTRGAGSGFTGMTLEEFTGNHTTTPLDQVNHSTAGASGTPTSPSITPTANDELIWALAVDNVSGVGLVDGTNGTQGSDDGSSDWTEFRVLTGRSGVSMTAAFAGSGTYEVFIASFKPAVAVTDTGEWMTRTAARQGPRSVNVGYGF